MTIVVGVDGSPVSRRALAWALAEGRLRGARVHAVYAWHPTGESFPAVDVPGLPLLDAGPGLPELERLAERLLDEVVVTAGAAAEVEQRTVRGHPAEVLVAASRGAELLVVGSRGHGALRGALLGSVSQACVQHATCPVVVIREPEASPPPGAFEPAEVIARQREQNAHTWAALVRLGVADGDALALEFVYESGGREADDVLASRLRAERGYHATVEAGGVTGQTPPLPAGRAGLDEWVAWMVVVGHEHGCLFDGWTATVPSGEA